MRVKEESEWASLKLNIKRTKIMAFGPITSWQTEGGKVEVVTNFLFLISKITWMVTAAMKSEDSCFLAGKLWLKPRQCVEKQRHYSANKGPYSQGYGIPSGRVQLWELDSKKGKMPKKWCLWTVVLEKTPEIPLDSKEINQSIFREINPEYSLEGLMLKLKL